MIRTRWAVARATARQVLRATLPPLGALLICAAAHAAAPRGLIVELKDAPEHHEAAREGALQASATELRLRQRWQRVLHGAGLLNAAASQRAPNLRPNGRAAFVLEFDRALAAAEVDDYLARLRASPEVAWAEPNERESLQQSTTPSDPLFPGADGQWWLQSVGGSDRNPITMRLRGVPGLQRAWSLNNGSNGAAVAVLDTGVTAHPEMQGVWLPGVDLVSDPAMANDGGGRDSDPSDPGDWVESSDLAHGSLSGCEVHDSSWHGTVVAGIIGARTDNHEGVAATGWNTRIVPVRVAGKCGAEVADIVDGMRWAAGLLVANGRGWLPRNPNPVRIVNLSFGGNRPCSRAYQSAIDELRGRGVLVVAAAGNGQSAVLRPANCRGVVAVAALNRDGFKAEYSNFGLEVTLATVGGDFASGPAGALLADGGLLSLYNGGITSPGPGTYARHSGTSFATPVVAGTAALMLSMNPALSVDQLIDGLMRSARPHVRSPWLADCSVDHPGRCLCTAASCGAGMLDAEQALLFARDPAAYVAPARAAEVLDNPELAAAAGVPIEPAARPITLPAGATGGGGAFGWPWLILLGVAVALLRAAPRRA